MRKDKSLVIFDVVLGATVGGVIAAVSYKLGCGYTEMCIARGLEKFHDEGFLKFFNEDGLEIKSVEAVNAMIREKMNNK